MLRIVLNGQLPITNKMQLQIDRLAGFNLEEPKSAHTSNVIRLHATASDERRLISRRSLDLKRVTVVQRRTQVLVEVSCDHLHALALHVEALGLAANRERRPRRNVTIVRQAQPATSRAPRDVKHGTLRVRPAEEPLVRRWPIQVLHVRTTPPRIISDHSKRVLRITLLRRIVLSHELSARPPPNRQPAPPAARVDHDQTIRLRRMPQLPPTILKLLPLLLRSLPHEQHANDTRQSLSTPPVQPLAVDHGSLMREVHKPKRAEPLQAARGETNITCAQIPQGAVPPLNLNLNQLLPPGTRAAFSRFLRSTASMIS